MDIIESIKKDKAYLKCKLIVKNWEKDFKAKFARTPSKFDIKEAPVKIKYAYKKYFQLKSVALENSLSLCEFDENDDEVTSSPERIRHFESIAGESLNSQPEQLLPDLPTAKELQELLSDSKLPTGKKIRNPFVDNLSKKLFQDRKFSIRNPRKSSLSKSLSIESKENNENRQESSFDTSNNKISPVEEQELKFNENEPSCKLNYLESGNYLTTHCKEEYKSVSQVISVANRTETIKTMRQVDEAWLQRATGLPIVKKSDSPTVPIDKFGLSNVKLLTLKEQKTEEKPLDFIENSESEEEDKSLSKLKPALKKRKIDDNTDSLSVMEYQTIYENNSEQIESITKKKKIARTKQVKRKAKPDTCENEVNPPDLSEYVPFGLDSNIVPRHGNVANIAMSQDQIANTSTSSKKAKDFNEVDKLESKIRNGTLNDNFVKINIEKKVFVRGKKGINYSKYKKQLWKDKKALHAGMEFPESGKVSCFKCGQTGHMARYCTAHKGDSLLPLESYAENDLPTLEDMQDMVTKETSCDKLTESIYDPSKIPESIYKPSKIPESILKMLEESQNNISKNNVKPIYPEDTNQISETPTEIYEALLKFGHNAFKPGQEKAIRRILCGMSTLLILSTGGGKSLCYQLPAYIYSQHYKCITLVISPLVSLMEDQVLSMPSFVRAGCLHTNQPPTHRRKIIQCIKDGEINILLISPEALISGDTSNGFTGLFKSLPQIAFACIDEAHCVSQWSHNFRPSYLMISRVLREKLNVKCILGLTATASQPTIKSVINHINVPDGLSGVITNPTLPENLCLSVSFEKDKDRALVSLITSEHISPYNSIIVYCIRRDECERVAAVLRSCLQEPHKVNMERQNLKRKRMSYIAEAYHAGMSAAQRKKIQKHFMDGTLRVIVATVAFGMGINKSDIRCIIHYNMPSSFEFYVQEVGRAGRDGKNAYCHVFMTDSNNDKNELLKHIHANSTDRPTIRKLLQLVFIPCECSLSQASGTASTSLSTHTNRCNGHEVGIPIDNTVEDLDLPSENIATLLCYIELHPKQYIKVLNNAYVMCKISSYGGPGALLQATKSCSPLSMAYVLEGKKDKSIMNKNILEFNVIEVAAALGWESGMTKYHLKNLEWTTEGGTSKRSLLKVEFHILGFRIKACGDLNSTELDAILDDIHQLVINQEKTMLYQLEEINVALSKYGNYTLQNNALSKEALLDKSNSLKSAIRDYFEREEITSSNIVLKHRPLDIDRVTSDVSALIASYKDCTFTGRSIARIFQGISSPNYPALVWGRCRFWRSHLHEDFYGLVRIATEQILRMKMI